MLFTKQHVGYQYDTDGRLTAISDPVINRSYTYDAGNRITHMGVNGQVPDTNHFDFSFTHDPLDRLTNESVANGVIQSNFSYDANSNLLKRTNQFGSNIQTTAAPIIAGTNHIQNYQYDGSGKVTSDGQRSYTYNSEGRIERIQNGSVGVYNAYNALGQRVQKNIGDSKTYFLYDESGALTGEYDTNGNVIREYAYLAGRPVLMMADDSVLHIHTDHLGTPRAVSGWIPNATTGWSGVALWRMDGDAFGDVQPQLANIKMPLRMAGQYADDETGLFYNYFRFYDPKTGRYVENDPIDLAGGLNRYAYVGGSPLSRIDPKGLVEWNGTIFSRVLPIAYFDILTLRTKCINGKEGYARVHGNAWAVGFGAALTITGGSITLEDSLSDVNPDVFNGVYKKFGAGIGLGAIYGITALEVGGARTPFEGLAPSWGGGIYDISIGAGAGRATVIESKVKDCGCEK